MRKFYSIIVLVLSIIIWGCKEDPPVKPDTSIGPVVKIIWPQNGANVLDTTYITIDAKDDKSVIRVEIFIDNINNESMTMTVEPFRVALYAEYYDPSTPHTIIAKAYDEDNNVTSSEEVTINTLQFQPTNLIATLTSDTSLSLSWRDNSNVETGFTIEQKVSSGNWQPLVTVDSNVVSKTLNGEFRTSEIYHYRIRAFNDIGISSFSEIDTAVIRIPVPTKLKIIAESSTSIQFEWLDNCNYETGYKIERSVNGGSFAEIGVVPANQNSFLVTGLDTSRNYQYRVRTLTTYNVSTNSDIVSTGYILSGSPIRVLVGHTGVIKSGLFTQDDQFIITAGFDRQINIYSANDGTLVRTIPGDATFHNLDLSPDGSTIAGACEDGTIKLWNVFDGSLIRTLTGHTKGVLSVKFNSDGTQLVSGGKDEKVILWNAPDGSLIDSLVGHTGFVTSVLFTPDRQKIISAEYNRVIKIWNVSDAGFIGNLTGHTGVVFDIDVNPTGSQLVSVSNDRTVKIWNLNNYTLIKSLPGHTNSIYAVKYTSKGLAIASAGADRQVRFWRSDNGVFMKSISYLAETINYLSFNRDGSKMLTGGSSLTSTLWQVGYIWSIL